MHCCLAYAVNAQIEAPQQVIFRSKDQAAAEKILPLIHDHHLLLVSDSWYGEVHPLG